ncbi:MAG TPA: sulfite dehydrogenase [Candidatus Tectomicrobia bacterium]|nr:sulfite dehydrogenase [Candidatus Tectomicrobia bacterium]
MPRGKPPPQNQSLVEPVAGNGLLDRRFFLKQGFALLGAGGLAAVSAPPANAADPPHLPAWMRSPGAGMSEYGSPAKYESKVVRTLIQSRPGTTGSGASRTPLEALDGMITPSGLHFERHHSGVPDITPDTHRLLIHGLVKRPLIFTMEALLRYPMVSRLHFLECSGNSNLMYGPTPPVLTCGQVHGLVSCSEWTGVPLRLLLEEAGADLSAPWLLAEGADAAAMSRSVPMAKALDDAFLALYQNGERLRPENGYPVRLFLPGYEGNMNVKWLRRITVTPTPTMTKDETSKYTDLQADGKALMWTFPMGVKSVITRPSPGVAMQGPGRYEVSGIAWSGHGTITKVDVSADGGQTWAEAALSPPVLPRALTRFRLAWQWNGAPAVLKSRATDDTGAVQPTREALLAGRGTSVFYHYHAIQAWQVETTGEVKNVYA